VSKKRASSARRTDEEEKRREEKRRKVKRSNFIHALSKKVSSCFLPVVVLLPSGDMAMLL